MIATRETTGSAAPLPEVQDQTPSDPSSAPSAKSSHDLPSTDPVRPGPHRDRAGRVRPPRLG